MASPPQRVLTNIAGQDFTLPPYLVVRKVVGSGAYGTVVSAEDTRSGDLVAIKKVKSWLHDLIDAKRVLREVKLMRFLARHENLTGIADLDGVTGPTGELADIYICTPLMETDLHKVIYSRQKLSTGHVQYFLYQLLRGLKFLHSANVIHRDLKPSNLLVNANCDLRICDFGLARGVHETDGSSSSPDLLTEYVVTRWYRAPEVLLACRSYSKPADLWAVGCIFAELLLRKPLFAGADYVDQLRLILGQLGSPSEEDYAFVTSEKARSFLARHAGKPRGTWKAVFKACSPPPSPEALDLLDRLLTFNPARRITVTEALAHPYLASLHDESDEPVSSALFDFSFEKTHRLDRAGLQTLMWGEIRALRAGGGGGGGNGSSGSAGASPPLPASGAGAPAARLAAAASPVPMPGSGSALPLSNGSGGGSSSVRLTTAPAAPLPSMLGGYVSAGAASGSGSALGGRLGGSPAPPSGSGAASVAVAAATSAAAAAVAAAKGVLPPVPSPPPPPPASLVHHPPLPLPSAAPPHIHKPTPFPAELTGSSLTSSGFFAATSSAAAGGTLATAFGLAPIAEGGGGGGGGAGAAFIGSGGSSSGDGDVRMEPPTAATQASSGGHMRASSAGSGALVHPQLWRPAAPHRSNPTNTASRVSGAAGGGQPRPATLLSAGPGASYHRRASSGDGSGSSGGGRLPSTAAAATGAPSELLPPAAVSGASRPTSSSGTWMRLSSRTSSAGGSGRSGGANGGTPGTVAAGGALSAVPAPPGATRTAFPRTIYVPAAPEGQLPSASGGVSNGWYAPPLGGSGGGASSGGGGGSGACGGGRL